MVKPVKVLACGDVEGNFNKLFTRVKAIQKKAGPFDMLLCVGSFFGPDNSEWASYTSGENTVPVPTFVLGADQQTHNRFYPDPDGCELCLNVTYLGRRGLYTESSGLTIAYLSGLDGSTPAYNDRTQGVQFSRDDIQALVVPVTAERSYKGVDILLTSQWPKGVEKFGSAVEGVDSMKVGSEVLSQVALTLKPRYHLCGKEGEFYERQPYRNHKVLQEAAQHTTRLISLAKVGNSQKKKFIYAFNITPMKNLEGSELTKQPQDSTECPYKSNPALLKGSQQEEKAQQFFYDQKALDKGKPRGGHRGGQGDKRRSEGQGGPAQKKAPQPTGPCWFCLGSPEVEKHLVVSVGTQCYTALAKGGLTDDHILILPISHHQSTVSAPSEVIDEIQKYKSSLKKHFESQDKSVVFYERNYKSQHLQIQAVPVPKDLADEIGETFQGCALSQNIELHEIPPMSDLKQIVPEGAPYFYLEIPSGEKFLYRIKKGFPLQFGREALAHNSLLNLPLRVDWRNCKSSKEEETQLSKKFRSRFQKYDFTLM